MANEGERERENEKYETRKWARNTKREKAYAFGLAPYLSLNEFNRLWMNTKRKMLNDRCCRFIKLIVNSDNIGNNGERWHEAVFTNRQQS